MLEYSENLWGEPTVVEPARVLRKACTVSAAEVPLHVLILEDNLIIALDVEEIVRGCGAKSVRTVTDVATALQAIAEAQPDFALLDVNLGRETCFPVADRLLALRVPFVFTSGYSDRDAIPDQFAAIPSITKPYSAETIGAALTAGAKKS